MITPGATARSHFPIFADRSKRLAYLDTAASSQKPKVVIDRLSHFLSKEHANIHRGAYSLSAHATESYDKAREVVARFIGAKDSRSVVFVRGTTEAINLVASSYGEKLKAGDVVLLTVMEHHSNIVPWQLLEKRRGVKVEFVDVHNDGSLNLEDLTAKLKSLKPKILSVTMVSNALGTVNPIAEIVAEAYKVGAKVLVDAAQGVAHQEIDVAALNVDFLAASGHKMYGPTGIGFLYGKTELLESMDPYQGGGDMIEKVAVEGSTWAEIPRRFEAGTPAIAEAIALGTAVEFIESIGRKAIAAHEHKLFQSGFEKLKREPGVKLYGPATAGKEQVSILPFTIDGAHPHDVATIADSCGVQIRAGHHCTMPLLKRLGVQATARASLGVYSEEEDLDCLIEAVQKARRMFAVI